MSFIKLSYLYAIIPITIILIFCLINNEKKFFTWIKTYWFLKRRLSHLLSSCLFFIGLFLLALALGDLRGKEEIIKGKLAENKTIILIDSSASMLAEDVRPNRFKKGLLLAKHFLKKAVGQKVSIVVFSDDQKRIVPFTSDLNLIDARLGSLEEISLSDGGSNITLAIKEAEKYFLTKDGVDIGNILLITDGEENVSDISLNISDKITLGVIAVGTSKGSTIPLRDQRGISRGVKKFNGRPVITKIDEGYLKKLGQGHKNYRYWISSSYSLPTEEVVSFFNNSHRTKSSKGNIRIRPVKAQYLLIPAIVFMILSYLLRLRKAFALQLLTFMIITGPSFTYSSQAYANENDKQVAQDKLGGHEKRKSESVLTLEEQLKENELSVNGKKQLSKELLKEGFFEDSAKLYSETLKSKVSDENKREYLNLGAAQFQSGQFNKGLKTYNKLIDYLEENKDKELYNKVKNNLAQALKRQEKQKNNKDQKDHKNQDNKDSKSENEKKQSGNSNNSNNSDSNDNKNKSSSGKDNKEQNKEGKQKESKEKNDGREKEDKKKSEKKKSGKSEDKKNQDGKDGERQDKNKDKKSDKTREDKKQSRKKIPALLKQLISDDNKLQKKMIDAETKKRKTRDKKDW